MDYKGYCMRVDALDGYGEKLQGLTMCADYRSIVAVRHKGNKGENPHYHLVVQTEVAGQAFRVRMRKIFDQGQGNGHMSIKPWDGNIDAISYLFHEDEDAVVQLRHNISDETLTQARERNKAITQMVMASKAKAAWHLESVVYEQIKNLPGHQSETSIGSKLILAALRNGKYVPQPWHIRAMTQRIQFQLLNGEMEAEEDFAYRLARNIFYQE